MFDIVSLSNYSDKQKFQTNKNEWVWNTRVDYFRQKDNQSIHVFKHFRYSGKTQKQMQEFVRDNFVKRQSFQRWAMFYLQELKVVKIIFISVSWF